MDQVTVVSGTHKFGHLDYDLVVELSGFQWEHLAKGDIHLTLHGNPGPNKCVEQLHVYLNEHDLTGAVISCLGADLDEADRMGTVRGEYEAAMAEWLHLARSLIFTHRGSLHNYYSGGETTIEKEEEVMERLLAADVLSQNLNSLGHSSTGWNGNLHIFNFVYGYLSLPPLSLNRIWQHYRQNTPDLPPNTPETWQATGSARLMFAIGERRLGNDFWEPPGLYKPLSDEEDPSYSPVEGTLSYRIELHYHNPLDDAVAELQRIVQELREDLDSLAQTVADLAEDVQGLQGLVTQLRQDLEALAKKVADYLKQISDKLDPLQTELDAIAGHVESIKLEFAKANTAFATHKDKLDGLAKKIEELHRIIQTSGGE